jgi:hypothetical protein
MILSEVVDGAVVSNLYIIHKVPLASINPAELVAVSVSYEFVSQSLTVNGLSVLGVTTASFTPLDAFVIIYDVEGFVLNEGWFQSNTAFASLADIKLFGRYVFTLYNETGGKYGGRVTVIVPQFDPLLER